MPRKASNELELELLPQPDEVTCGPTCLHGLYRYYGDELPLEQVISEVRMLPGGGTLAVSLACHALRRGYRATLYTYNLRVFDPSWFHKRVDLRERLRAQLEHKEDEKLALATERYLELLSLGGKIRYAPMKPKRIRGPLSAGKPILTGLSATYLYGSLREHDNRYDDLVGDPAGHFVVLSGYHKKSGRVTVQDPLHDNPRFGRQTYTVGMHRVLAAILLGIATYDANLLIVEPK